MSRPAMIGTAPDSWGVWYAEDPHQTPWRRFLAEAAASGYTRIELGPYGYLPTDPALLGEELARHGLSLTAGTIFEHLHRPDSWQSTWAGVSAVAQLSAALGARHLVVIPEFWRDPISGAELEDPRLTPAEWQRYGSRIDRLARTVREEYGLQLQFHPHADTHVDTHARIERLLEHTDPALVQLCLDTGHIAYCHGDSLKLIADHPERIGYVHLKQVDPQIRAQVDAEGLGFGEAVRRGAMCEPPRGLPDLRPIVQALADLDHVDLFAIVEQDLYPCAPEVPAPIAARTLSYLRSCASWR